MRTRSVFITSGARNRIWSGLRWAWRHADCCRFVILSLSFLIMRPFEFIRHAAYQNLSIRLVGSGRNKEYGNEGFTQWAIEDTRLIDLLPQQQGVSAGFGAGRRAQT